MKVIEKKLSEIKPYEKNPRHNEEAVQYVAESIKQFGIRQPIVIDKDNVIVAGHTRYLAAKQLKLKTFPCVMADDLPEEKIRAYRLADNKTAEKASWDIELLDMELAEIETIDMGLLGFDEEKEGEAQEPGAVSADTSYNYKEQYGVIVLCKDEQEQEAVYNRLAEEGYECKVVAV